MLMHRPQEMNKPVLLKMRRRGNTDNYNFIERSAFAWYPAGWRLNKKTIGKQHSRLHYLACHAPEPIRKKWASVYKVFMARHFGDNGKACIRYLNTYTAYSWL